MNKADLIAVIANEVDMTKAVAAKALDAITASIAEALKKNDSVALVGFGTFKVGKRVARTGRNPKTGAVLEIPASNSPSFSAGKTLKDAVN